MKPAFTLLLCFFVVTLCDKDDDDDDHDDDDKILDYTGKEHGWDGVCHTGKAQSPIDVPSKAESEIGDELIKIVSADYKKMGIEKIDFEHGYKYKLDYVKDGTLVVEIEGTKYTYELKDIHFHIKSEHRLDGKQMDGEMHAVHSLKGDYGDSQWKKQNLVVGVLFNVDEDLKDKDSDLIFAKNSKGTELYINPLNLKDFITPESSFFYYQGGLTTPTCDENVNWIVLSKVRSISEESFSALEKEIFSHNILGNARAAKDLNGRTVYYVNSSKRIRISVFFLISLLLLI